MVGRSEQERETEFGMLKHVVSNLVHALEDKTTTDILNVKSSNEDNRAQSEMLVTYGGQKSAF